MVLEDKTVHVNCFPILNILDLWCFQLYAANLSKKANELKREKKKSDLLLFQMLPPSVATQLKQTRQVGFNKITKIETKLIFLLAF